MGSLPFTDYYHVEAGDCCSDPIMGVEGTILFLKGSDPASGTLTKDFPSGGYESCTINPGSGLIRQALGHWESAPLEFDWTVDALIELQIPAWGNGQSISTQFFIEFLVDGESYGETETASDGMMYMYMYWLGNETFSFTAAKGQTIGINIEVIENGPGGEMRWDSEEAIAQLWTTIPSLKIEVSDQPFESRHESRVSVFSNWGEEDIDSVDMLVMDPSEMKGGPVWDDIENNATIYRTTDYVTVDWDDSESGNGYRYGTWIWTLPEDAPEKLDVVGFANDGGLGTSFTSTSVIRPGNDSDQSGISSSKDDVPWVFIIGIMIAAGIAIAGYQSRIMEHDVKRVLAIAGTITIAGIVIMSTFYSAAFSSEKQPAPDFTIQTIDDKIISLDDLDGKVVVLSLTGITCSFCEPQMEEMVKAWESYKNNSDVVFLSVNIMSGDDHSAWREFKDELGAEWDFAMDNDEMVGKFRIYSMPVIIMIDEEGEIAYTHKDSLLKAGEFRDKIEDVKEGNAVGGITFTGGSLMFAFFVGVTAFFAPCAFPLLPGFMTYKLGKLKRSEEDTDGYYDEEGYWIETDSETENPGLLKGMKIGIAAMLGITGVMIAFALLGWLFEDVIQSNMKYYTPALGLVIVALGVIFLLHIPLPTANIKERITSTDFYQQKFGFRIDSWQGDDASEASLHLGIIAYGAGYASASMGCHGPIFIAVLLIGMAGGFLLTLEMILLYALGMGICMVIVCVLVAAAENTAIEKLQEKLPLINKISGLFLIIAGIWIFWFGYQAFI